MATEGQAGRRAQDVASHLSQQAEGAASELGQRLENLGGTIRERAPAEGMAGSAASAVADRLEAGGRYLQEQDLATMAKDLGEIVRQYPVPSILAAFGVGFLLARTIRS
jgi:hypothetical protein